MAWHFAGLCAASIASPLSAHKAILSISVADNILRIMRCQLMQRYSGRWSVLLSVTCVTPLV